jgi:two-component system, LytTR family, response regulator
MQTHLIAVRTCTGVFYFAPQEIIRCEASSNYTKLYFNNNKTLLVAKTLRTYETILDACNFIRIHHSSLINKSYIEKVEQNGTVILKDGSVLITSRRRKQFIKKQLLFLKTAC